MTRHPPSLPDTVTVVALAAAVWPVAVLLHEGLGHGGACLLTGGTLEGVSLARCACDHAGSEWAVRGAKAAGTLVNLATGGAAMLVTPHVRQPHLRYAVALFAAVSAWMGFGYLMVDPLAGFGDWTAFLRGLPSALRWPLSGLGVAGFSLTIRWWLRVGLSPFLGLAPAERRATARALSLPAWGLVGGLAMTVVTLLDRAGPVFALTGALATLAGTSPLAWCWTMAERGGPVQLPPLHVSRDPRARAVGVVVFVALAAVFARGCPA